MKQFLIALILFAAGCAGDDKTASTDINGEILFKANCASCHKSDQAFTGPALRGALQRWSGDKKAMYAFIRNPAQPLNAYAESLKKKWAPTVMTAFPLSDDQIDAIMKYVETGK